MLTHIEELFHAALAQAPSTRTSFLATACGDDESLRAGVEALLKAHDEAPPYIVAATPLAALLPPPIEERCGPYQLQRALGEGGMGTVWLATRADQQYEKQVALKFIRPTANVWLDPATAQRRFYEERQLLARLEHPHIARLLDGGTTESGLPWLAMEYIEGVPLDEYCRQHDLSLTARLELFRTVCAAVQYAHQNLIVHRDLKPANILVTAEGTPKLLDFGIAKLLQDDATTTNTATAGPHPMTLRYASPEQVRESRVSTASEVYSLGVILYELLTGHSPYPETAQFPHELAQAICESEPLRPSLSVTRHTTPDGGKSTTPLFEQKRRLRRWLAGDLDNIVLMALRKEPARRYASVEQLAEDVRRYLKELPVRAAKDTRWYRVTKLVRRHRVEMVTALIAVGLLLAVTAYALWQARTARQEATRAEQERKKAERISNYLQNVFSYAEPNAMGRGGGRSPEVRLEEALRDAEQRLETELNEQPEVKADLYITLGKVWHQRGDYHAAERDFRLALALNRQLHGERHPQVARSLSFLDAAIHQRGRQPGEAFLMPLAIEIMRETAPDHDLLPWMVMNEGTGLTTVGQFAQGEAMIQEARELFVRKFGAEHQAVALTVVRLAESLKMRGELEPAKALYREYLQRMSQKPPDGETPNAIGNIARIELAQEHYTEAENGFHEALAISEQALGKDHPHSIGSRQGLAELHYRQGNFVQAESEARRALEIAQKKYAPGHNLIRSSQAILSKILFAAGRPAQAATYLRDAMVAFRSTVEKRPCIGVEGEVGECLLWRRQYEEAERFLLQGYECLLPYRDKQSPEGTEMRRQLVQLYEAWGKPERAARYR